jgi:hypothetical protein
MLQTKGHTKMKHYVCPVQFFCELYGFRGEQKAIALIWWLYFPELISIVLFLFSTTIQSVHFAFILRQWSLSWAQLNRASS